MKKIWILAAAAAAVSAAACSGGGGGSKGLSIGTYVVSNDSLNPDECGLGGSQFTDGDTLDVTAVSSTVVTIGGTDFDRSGDTLTTTPSTFTIDWSTTAGQIAAGVPNAPLSQGYNCMETDSFGVGGTISGSTIHLASTVDYGMDASSSAAECIAANSSGYSITLSVFPCNSTESFDLNKQ